MNKISKYPVLYYFLPFVTTLYILFVLFQYKIETSLIKYLKNHNQSSFIEGKVLWIQKNTNTINYIILSKKEKYFLTFDNTFLEEKNPKIKLNDEIVLKVKSKPLSLKNSYHYYLYNSFGILNIGYIEDIVSIKTNTNLFYKLFNYVVLSSYYLREEIIKIVNKNLHKPYDSVILRLTLGYKDQEISEIISYFQDAGVIHVLVVSGLHVGFVYVLVFFILKFIPFINRKIRIIISLLSVVFYMFITGCSSPVVRATIIILCFGITELLNRKQSSFHSLILSALVLLIINPYNLFNPSFQLSFASCFGIVYFYGSFYDNFKEYIEKIPSIIKYIVELFLVTFSVQMMLIPFIIYYFNKISLISFISNIVVIPLTSLLLWLSMCLYIFEFIFIEIHPLFWLITEKLIFIYINIVKFFSYISLNIVNIARLSFLNTIIYYFLIFLVPFFLKYKKYKFLILTLFFSVASLFLKFEFDKKSKITFLDVSLGDCIIVSTKDKQNVVIDIGESKYVAMYNVSSYLRKNKITQIEHLIITHPHYTHYGGATYLIDNFKIKNIYINSIIPQDDNEYKIFIKKIKDKNINLVVVDKEKSIKFSDIEINLLPNFVNYQTDRIEFFDTNSILVKVEHKDFVFILPNDIPFYYIKDKIKNIKDKNIILQLPRHGKYKEDVMLLKEFLNNKKFKIKFAVVSTDEIKFEERILKIPIYSTSLYGDIEIIFDDKTEDVYKIENKLGGISLEL